MKFLLDQDVYFSTARFLRKIGHKVTTVSEIGGSQTPDIELLKIAKKEKYIFVTRDRDFGKLVFVKHLETGVIYIRTFPNTLTEVHEEIKVVLKSHSEKELRKTFIVVEPGRYRFRKLN